MEEKDLLEQTFENAKEAYSFVKEKKLTEPLLNAAKRFANWFGNLFKGEPLKKRVKLMEDLNAKDADINLLKGQLQVLIETNENLKSEIEKNIAELEKEKVKDENAESLKIVRSKLKNVNFGNVNTSGGDFIQGDTTNKY